MAVVAGSGESAWGRESSNATKMGIAFEALFRNEVYRRSIWSIATHRRYEMDFLTASTVQIPVNATGVSSNKANLAGRQPNQAVMSMERGAISKRFLVPDEGTKVAKSEMEFKLDSHLSCTIDFNLDNMRQARADVITAQLMQEAQRQAQMLDARIAMEVVSPDVYDTGSGKPRQGFQHVGSVTLDAGVNIKDFTFGSTSLGSNDANALKIFNAFRTMDAMLGAENLKGRTAAGGATMAAFMRSEVYDALRAAVVRNSYRFDELAGEVVRSGEVPGLFGIPIFIDNGVTTIKNSTGAAWAVGAWGNLSEVADGGNLSFQHIPKSSKVSGTGGNSEKFLTHGTYIYFAPVNDSAVVAYAEYPRTPVGGAMLMPQWQGGNSVYKDSYQWDYLADFGAMNQDVGKFFRIQIGSHSPATHIA